MSAEFVSYDPSHQGPEVRDTRRTPMRVLSGRGLRRDVEFRNEGPQSDGADEVLAVLKQLPATATLRDVVEVLVGERPNGHSQTYANVVSTQRALLRLAKAATGRDFEAWEPEH